jgi:membrane-associated protease RseP (regulator of RpoE activity)
VYSAILAGAVVLVAVTVIHEVGHLLAVHAKRGRVLRFQLGRGPVLWRTTGRQPDFLVSMVPMGGRIHYDGVPAGTGEAVVAVGGASANLVTAFLAFAMAALLGADGSPVHGEEAGPLAFAAANAGAWFWAAPGALLELVRSGSALELRAGMWGLADLLVTRPVYGFPYALGALSALWAALNLIPIPVVRTDGWHVARALWRSGRP